MNLVFFHSEFFLPKNVYVHFPVCQHHCSYCDFNVVSRKKIEGLLPSSDYRDLWTEELCRQLALLSVGVSGPKQRLQTLYLGGGTPSLLDERHLNQLREAFEGVYEIDVSDFEWTLECNPETLSGDKLAGFRRAGVNRLSLGVQTREPGQLRRLERLATAEVIDQCLEDISREFKNFSLDFMIGIPDQTQEALERDLSFIRRWRPPHLSIYLLTIADHHKWIKKPAMAKRLVSAAGAAEFYRQMCEALGSDGYHHYEVSNFSLPEFESRHNQNYWNDQSDYLGLGPGAHGFLKSIKGERRRYESIRDVLRWAKEGSQAVEFSEVLSNEQQRVERAYLHLRTGKEISSEGLSSAKLEAFEAEGFIRFNAKRSHLSLTESGWLLMESLAVDLIV